MSSTISAARTALYNALVAAAADVTSGLHIVDPASGLNLVQIAWGDPEAAEAQIVVSMRGITNSSEVPATIGDTAHGERYTIEVTVKWHGPDSDAQTVDNGAFAVADAVRKVVSTKTTTPPIGRMLGGAVQWAFVSSQQSQGAMPAQEGGWVCFVDLSVACAGTPLTP